MAIVCMLTLGGAGLRGDVMLETRERRLLGADATAKTVLDADWQLQREILEHAVMTAPDSSWQLEPDDPRGLDPRRAATLVAPAIIWRDVLDGVQTRPSFPPHEVPGFSRLALLAGGFASLLVILLVVVLGRRLKPAVGERDW